MSVAAEAKGLEFKCNVEPDVPGRLVGDPGRLIQVLTNLAGNAVKFTEKGVVSVTVTLKKDSAEQCLLQFGVQDTGIGIPIDKMDRLFKSFSQVDSSTTRRYTGTGLGLAISKEIVEMMGGSIKAESREGQGSTFTFTAYFEKR